MGERKMRTLIISLLLLGGAAAYGQQNEIYFSFIDTSSMSYNFTPDTIPGWTLITSGENSIATQVEAYELKWGVMGRSEYIDEFKTPFNKDVIVWQFKRKGRR